MWWFVEYFSITEDISFGFNIECVFPIGKVIVRNHIEITYISQDEIQFQNTGHIKLHLVIHWHIWLRDISYVLMTDSVCERFCECLDVSVNVSVSRKG